jgi:ABC-2 type transport system permease protein
MSTAKNTCIIFKREFKGYFESPVAYVFLVVFLALIGFLTFSQGLGNFYERRIADLAPFFTWHPWVYLLLVPAATMGLWAEEHRAGTIELLFTMPITMTEAVLGKFLAAWAFIATALALTIPVMCGTVAYLGNPDWSVVATGYLGSVLLAGACVSIGMLSSSFTRNQVISFVMGLSVCLGLLLIGFDPVMSWFVSWAQPWLVEGIASLSLMSHYDSLQKGQLDVADIVYYFSVMGFMIMSTHLVLDNRKAA